MTLVLPLFCYIFFVSFMNEGVPMGLPIAVVDQDNSSMSRSFVRKLDASPQTTIKAHLGSYHEGVDAMQRGDIHGFIILPRNMQADAMAGRTPEVAFYANNSYLMSGSLIMRDLSTISALSSASLNIGMRAARGQSPEEIIANVQPVALDFHATGNPWANYSLYLSTILSHGLLQILILLTTVFSIGIEIKQGTAYQWLESAGGSMLRALAGKLLPYTLLFSLMAIAGNTLFFKYMQFPCQGSFFAIQVAAVLLVIAYQAVGVFILGMLTDFNIALTLSGVFGVLGLSFSGLTFPIEIMDAPLQGFTLLYPIRYYFYAYMDIAMSGLSFSQSILSFLALLAFLCFPAIILRRMKRMIIDSNPVNTIPA